MGPDLLDTQEVKEEAARLCGELGPSEAPEFLAEGGQAVKVDLAMQPLGFLVLALEQDFPSCVISLGLG